MDTERVKRRRGTTAQHAAFVGASGEVTTDITKFTQVVHDGLTAGGYPLAHEDLSTTDPATARTRLELGTAATTDADAYLQSVDLGYTASTRTITNTGGNNTVLPLFTSDADGLVPASSHSPGTHKYLRDDGGWHTVSGTGTVTSVDLTAPTGFSVSGAPITSAGTLAIAFSAGYSLPTDVRQATWDTAATVTSGLATVATTGAYSDLSGTPTAVTTTTAGLQPATAYGVITYAATINIDFSARNGQVNTVVLTGGLTLTGSNQTIGLSTSLYLSAGVSDRTLTFPAAWVFISDKPSTLPANKRAKLSVEVTNDGAGTALVVAGIAIQP